MKYINALSEELEIYGVFYEDGKFRRIPESVAVTVNDGVKGLHSNTAGGRIRFKTNSSEISVKVLYDQIGRMGHFTMIGSAGLDLYADNIFVGAFHVPYDLKDSYEGTLVLDGKMHEILINMPTYSDVRELRIGLDDGAEIMKAEKYINDKPVVFYGSSITQGGCCSRPGNTYQAIVSRHLCLDYINLGFSGSAKGEDTIIDYMAGLDMNCFVLDYDHNAPTPEHLLNTHYKVYEGIRRSHPDIPIIMMTRPKFHLNSDETERLEIVKESFNKAKNSGDGNVYFIPGPELISPMFIETATVDNCHPNDSGFVSMAARVEKEIKKVLNL